jgi:hypothetical protein
MVMCELEITKILQLMHDPESLLPAAYAKNTLETHDATGPHSRFYRVSKTAVHTISLPEGSP